MQTSSVKGPWYTRFFTSGHLLVLSIIVILVAGISAVQTLPRLEDPRIDTRNVLVLTPFPGASAERVEALVTDVIEDELRQLFEIKELKTTSRAEISVVSIELQAWVDNSTNEEIFSKIRDRLGNAKQRFPNGVGEPLLDDQRGATAFTLLVALKPASPSVAQSPTIVTRMAEELADRLRNVPGTELVRNYGELDEEISVTINAQQLSSVGLSVDQASRLIAANDPKLPAGMMRNEQQNIRIQVSEELDSLDTIRNIPLLASGQGTYLRLGDIADVRRGWRNPPQEIALLNGEQAVLVAARMQTTVRVDHWMANAKEMVEQFDKEYKATVSTDIIFDQNLYTDARLSDLTQNLLLGSLVVMIVVLLFMGNRAAWIVGLSLPLSAAFAIFSLSFYGQQIHQMSIFGIIVAIGLLIDNAIVITDEIRTNLIDPALSRLDALVKSLRHLFVPLFASTLTTILGFMPIFLLPGNIGDFVSPIAISVVMALIGSLFISLTIIAALAARFVRRPQGDAQLRWYQQGVQMPLISNWFRQFLTHAVERPAKVLSFTIALPILGFVLAGQLGNVFFPSADRDQFEVYVWMPNGTAIHQTKKVVDEIDLRIESNEEVNQVTWLIGGSVPSHYYNQLMNRDNSPNFAQAVVTVDSVDEAAALIGRLQSDLDEQVPQAKVVVRAFGQGPPISAPIGVDIYGTDLQILNELGKKVRLAMSQVPGITQSIASITVGEPEMVMNTSSDSSQLANLTLTDIAQQLQSAVEGQVGGSILEGTEEVPIRVRVARKERENQDGLAVLPLINSQLGQEQNWVPLSALGDFELRPTISGITRNDGIRVNKIEAYLLPNATAIDVSNELQAILNSPDFVLPEGYSIKMKGDADQQQEALGQLATYAPVLLVLMVATLILSFNSVKLAGVIGAVAVLSVGLGMLSLWISGLPVGFNPILGSAGLIGVAINGSIVIIAAINSNPEAKAGNTAAIVKETLGCSRHILSTTVTTVGGFIPLLLFSEGTFWPPLAVVLAGGVGFSVILSLLFTPTLVAAMARRRAANENISGQLVQQTS